MFENKSKMILTKEITYKLKYNGTETYLTHHIDSLFGRRHTISEYDEESTHIGIDGTGISFQEIESPLIGERIHYEDSSGKIKAELWYFLSDINYYVKMDYMYENEGSEWKHMWSRKVGDIVYLKGGSVIE